MSKSILYSSVVIACFLTACSKDEISVNCFTPPENAVIEDSGTYIINPHFNPNDADEFLYVTTEGIRKHRLSTAEDVLVYIGNVILHPYWGKSDMILFNSQGNIFTIRPDGTGLKQHTENVSASYAFWNFSGTRIIYRTGAIGIDGTKSTVIDTAGNVIYEMPNVFNYLDCSLSPNITLHQQGKTVCRNDTTFTNPVAIFEYPYNMGDLVWLNENEIIWSSKNNLYKGNITNKQISYIREGCFGQNYLSFTLSPDRQKIVVVVERHRLKTLDTVVRYYELHMLNVDGSNEEVIELP